MDKNIKFETKEKFSDKFTKGYNDYTKNSEMSNKNKKTMIIIYFSFKLILLFIFEFITILYENININNLCIISYTATIFVIYFILILLILKFFNVLVNNPSLYRSYKKIFEIFTVLELEIELLFLILRNNKSISIIGINFIFLIFLKSIAFVFFKDFLVSVYPFFTIMKLKTFSFITSGLIITFFTLKNDHYDYFIFSLFILIIFYISNLMFFYRSEIFAEKNRKLLSMNQILLNLINYLGFIINRKNINFLISFDIDNANIDEIINVRERIKRGEKNNMKKINLFSNNFLNEINITKINNLKFLNFDNLDFNNFKFKNKKNHLINSQNNNNIIGNGTYSIIKDSSLFFQDRESYLNQKKKIHNPRHGNYYRNYINNKKIQNNRERFSTSFHRNNISIPSETNNFISSQSFNKRDHSAPLHEKKILENNSGLRISSSNKSNNLYENFNNNNNLGDKYSIYYIKSDSLMDKSSSFNYIDNSSKKNFTINSGISHNNKAESGFESNISSDDSDKASNNNNNINIQESSSFIDSSDINEFRSNSLLKIKTTRSIKNKLSYDIKNENEELLKFNSHSKDESSFMKNDKDYNIEVNQPLSNKNRNENEKKGILKKTLSLKLNNKKNIYNIGNHSRSANFLCAFPNKRMIRSLSIDNKLEQINEVNEELNKSKSKDLRKSQIQNTNILRRFSCNSVNDKKNLRKRNSLGFPRLKNPKESQDLLINNENKSNDFFSSNNDDNIQFKTNFSNKNLYNNNNNKEINDRNELEFPYRRKEVKILHSISNNSEKIKSLNKNYSFPREIRFKERSKKFSNDNIKNNNNNFDNNQSNLNDNNVPKLNDNNLDLENSLNNDYVVFLAENFKLQILNKLDKNNNLFSNNDYIYSKILDLFKVKKIIYLKNFNNYIIEILRSFEIENLEDFLYFGPLDIIKYNQNYSSEEINTDSEVGVGGTGNTAGIGKAISSGIGTGTATGIGSGTGTIKLKGIRTGFGNKFDEKSSLNDNNNFDSFKEIRDNMENNNEHKAFNISLFKKENHIDNNTNNNKIIKESFLLRENKKDKNNIDDDNNLDKESFMIEEKILNQSDNEKKGKSDILGSNSIIDVPPCENTFNERKINNIDNELKNLGKNIISNPNDENLFQKYILNNLEKIRRVNFYCYKINEEINKINYEKYINLNKNENLDSSLENFELNSISESNLNVNLKGLRNKNNNFSLFEKKYNKLGLIYNSSDNIIDDDNSRAIINQKDIELIEINYKNKKDIKNDNNNNENNINDNINYEDRNENKKTSCNKIWRFIKNFIKCKIFHSEKKHIIKKYIFAIEEVMFNLPINDNYIFEEIKNNNNNIYDNFMSSENLNNFNFNKKGSNSNIRNDCSDQIKEYCSLSYDLNFDNPLRPIDYSISSKKSNIIKKVYSNSYDFIRLTKIMEEKESFDFDSISYRNPKSKIHDRMLIFDSLKIPKKKSKLFSVERSNSIMPNNIPRSFQSIDKINEKNKHIFNTSDPVKKRSRKLQIESLKKKESKDSLLQIFNENSNIKTLTQNDIQKINYRSFIENLSALMHDFKHVVYDNLIFFDFLVMKYIHPIISININIRKDNNNYSSLNNNNYNNNNNEISENKKFDTSILELGSRSEDPQHPNSQLINIINSNSNSYSNSSKSSKFNSKDLSLIYQFILKLDSEKIKDDMIYLNVMKDYTTSMILNITNFMSNNNFLVGSLNELIDIIYISNVMVKIFNRRLEYENALTQDLSIKKKISIRAKFIDLEILRKLKINSNKNMIISLIYNIMSNSYKYTKIGEIEIQVKSININKNYFVEMKISDTGTGIPKEIIKNWGKAFNLNDNDKGSGLGQYLINTIAMKLNIQLMKPQNKKFPQNGTIIGILIPVIQEPYSSTRKSPSASGGQAPYESYTSNSNITIVNNSINLDQEMNFDMHSKEKSNHISISNSYSEMFNDDKIINYLQGNVNNQINKINENNNYNDVINNNNNKINNIKQPNTEIFNNDDINYNINKDIKNSNQNTKIQSEKNEKFQDNNNINNISLSNNQLSLSSRKYLNVEVPKKTYFKKKTNITIICLDDDPVFLSLLGNNLRRWTSSLIDYKFNLIFTDTFTNFFKEFFSLIENEIVPDFFIMDQNISPNIKGIECCQLINEFYKIYLKDEYMKNDFAFFFFTEETNMMNYKIMKKDNNILAKESVFGKLQITELIISLEEKLKIKRNV